MPSLPSQLGHSDGAQVEVTRVPQGRFQGSASLGGCACSLHPGWMRTPTAWLSQLPAAQQSWLMVLCNSSISFFIFGLLLMRMPGLLLPAMRENWVQFLGWEDPLEKGKATHSSILAWEIPWTEGSGGLESLGSQRVRLSD